MFGLFKKKKSSEADQMVEQLIAKLEAQKKEEEEDVLSANFASLQEKLGSSGQIAKDMESFFAETASFISSQKMHSINDLKCRDVQSFLFKRKHVLKFDYPEWPIFPSILSTLTVDMQDFLRFAKAANTTFDMTVKVAVLEKTMNPLYSSKDLVEALTQFNKAMREFLVFATKDLDNSEEIINKATSLFIPIAEAALNLQRQIRYGQAIQNTIFTKFSELMCAKPRVDYAGCKNKYPDVSVSDMLYFEAKFAQYLRLQNPGTLDFEKNFVLAFSRLEEYLDGFRKEYLQKNPQSSFDARYKELPEDTKKYIAAAQSKNDYLKIIEKLQAISSELAQSGSEDDKLKLQENEKKIADVKLFFSYRVFRLLKVHTQSLKQWIEAQAKLHRGAYPTFDEKNIKLIKTLYDCLHATLAQMQAEGCLEVFSFDEVKPVFTPEEEADMLRKYFLDEMMKEDTKTSIDTIMKYTEDVMAGKPVDLHMPSVSQ